MPKLIHQNVQETVAAENHCSVLFGLINEGAPCEELHGYEVTLDGAVVVPEWRQFTAHNY